MDIWRHKCAEGIKDWTNRYSEELEGIVCLSIEKGEGQ